MKNWLVLSVLLNVVFLGLYLNKVWEVRNNVPMLQSTQKWAAEVRRTRREQYDEGYSDGAAGKPNRNELYAR